MELPTWVPDAVRADFQQLLAAVLAKVDRRIRLAGRFDSYSFELSGPQPTEITVDREQELTGDQRAMVVAYDSRLKEESIDAVAVELTHRDAPPLLVVLRYRHRGLLRKVWYADPQIGPLRASR